MPKKKIKKPRVRKSLSDMLEAQGKKGAPKRSTLNELYNLELNISDPDTDLQVDAELRMAR